MSPQDGFQTGVDGKATISNYIAVQREIRESILARNRLRSVDDTVKAKITEIKDGRISLSLKALQADPWDKAADTYKEGETVKGEVYAFHPYGAVINLKDGIQGQIHVSEFGGVPEMKKELTAGETYEFKIESLKPEEKRMVLKLVK